MPTVSIFLLRNTWCLWFEVGVQLHSFTIGYPVVPAPLVEKTILSPLSCLATLVENQVVIKVKAYIWNLNFIPLIHVCPYTLLHGLNYCSFEVHSEIRKCVSSA